MPSGWSFFRWTENSLAGEGEAGGAVPGSPDSHRSEEKEKGSEEGEVKAIHC